MAEYRAEPFGGHFGSGYRAHRSRRLAKATRKKEEQEIVGKSGGLENMKSFTSGRAEARRS